MRFCVSINIYDKLDLLVDLFFAQDEALQAAAASERAAAERRERRRRGRERDDNAEDARDEPQNRRRRLRSPTPPPRVVRWFSHSTGQPVQLVCPHCSAIMG